MSTEYVEKFGYKNYTGPSQSRIKRVINLAWFEMASTWRRSTFGKILLIMILVMNFIYLFRLFTILPNINFSGLDKIEYARREISRFVSYYLFLWLFTGYGSFEPVGVLGGLPIPSRLGFLIIPLLGIAGSGLFADDKQGHLVEIYLSKLGKIEYLVGKIGAMFLYNNIILTFPMMILSFMYVQGSGLDHFQFLDFYALILLYGLICSLFLGMIILVLSILVEKRAYASLTFILLYYIGSFFGAAVFEVNSSNEYLLFEINNYNEYLLLIPGETFFLLLGYSIMGIWDLDRNIYNNSTIMGVKHLNLNDGVGLEYYHFYLMIFVVIIILSLFLYFRLTRLTTKGL